MKIEAYNEIADLCYKELKENDKILIYGKLDEKGRSKIIELEKGANLTNIVDKYWQMVKKMIK